jgi:benzoyl-CoA reductase/2-hydroxyglutaryl-CoA dehydratase subunit BcrC/BadD/HgdB
MIQSEGVEVIPFSYPYRRDEFLLSLQLERLAASLGVTLKEGEAWKQELYPIRRLAHRLDELTWREGCATGAENHLWSVSCSDFLGDPPLYKQRIAAVLAEASARPGTSPKLRLALVGIPPICSGLFEMVEERGARFVFDEIPRQFSMPQAGDSLLEQYRLYTYPYDIFGRIEDIRWEVERRGVQGVVHYVQSFCFRQVQDVLIRRAVNVPLLTLECDRPGPLDSRTLTRIEAFLELLAARLG